MASIENLTFNSKASILFSLNAKINELKELRSSIIDNVSEVSVINDTEALQSKIKVLVNEVSTLGLTFQSISKITTLISEDSIISSDIIDVTQEVLSELSKILNEISSTSTISLNQVKNSVATLMIEADSVISDSIRYYQETLLGTSSDVVKNMDNTYSLFNYGTGEDAVDIDIQSQVVTSDGSLVIAFTSPPTINLYNGTSTLLVNGNNIEVGAGQLYDMTVNGELFCLAEGAETEIWGRSGTKATLSTDVGVWSNRSQKAIPFQYIYGGELFVNDVDSNLKIRVVKGVSDFINPSIAGYTRTETHESNEGIWDDGNVYQNKSNTTIESVFGKYSLSLANSDGTFDYSYLYDTANRSYPQAEITSDDNSIDRLRFLEQDIFNTPPVKSGSNWIFEDNSENGNDVVIKKTNAFKFELANNNVINTLQKINGEQSIDITVHFKFFEEATFQVLFEAGGSTASSKGLQAIIYPTRNLRFNIADGDTKTTFSSNLTLADNTEYILNINWSGISGEPINITANGSTYSASPTLSWQGATVASLNIGSPTFDISSEMYYFEANINGGGLAIKIPFTTAIDKVYDIENGNELNISGTYNQSQWIKRDVKPINIINGHSQYNNGYIPILSNGQWDALGNKVYQKEVVKQSGFDNFILAGQSNADGQGEMGSNVPYMEGNEGVRMYNGTTFISPIIDDGTNHYPTVAPTLMGLDQSLGLLHGNRTKNIDIYKYAVGSTSMYNDWRVGAALNLAFKAGYLDAISKTTGATQYMVFYQGEQDATNLTWANDYEANLTAFINDVRVWAGSIPIYLVRIHASLALGNFPYRDIVRTAQENVASVLPNITLINVDDLELKLDGVHLNYESLLELGKRIYKEYEVYNYISLIDFDNLTNKNMYPPGGFNGSENTVLGIKYSDWELNEKTFDEVKALDDFIPPEEDFTLTLDSSKKVLSKMKVIRI